MKNAKLNETLATFKVWLNTLVYEAGLAQENQGGRIVGSDVDEILDMCSEIDFILEKYSHITNIPEKN